MGDRVCFVGAGGKAVAEKMLTPSSAAAAQAMVLLVSERPI